MVKTITITASEEGKIEFKIEGEPTIGEVQQMLQAVSQSIMGQRIRMESPPEPEQEEKS